MITKVSPPRWHQAQAYEKQTWWDNASLTGTDWNEWWADAFDGYEFLRNLGGRLIEQGCGPYTNIRLIEPVMKPDAIEIYDPLINTYLMLPCWVRENSSRMAACVADRLERWKPTTPNKAVVCLNVLDHVQNAELCMRNLVGGASEYLLLGQDLTYDDDLPEDVGHPIRLTHEWLAPFLTEFEPIIDRIIEGRDCTYHQHGCFIFAGRKK